MEPLRVGVVGATGYSGSVLSRLLAGHPHVRLAFCTSDKLASEPVAHYLGVRGAEGLRFEPNAAADRLARECDAVFLATSAEVSAKLAPPLVEAGRIVVDLSGAFRLAHASDYPRWYGFDHPWPALLERAHYGLPELFGAPPRGTLLVSNPGCYPTASMLPLAPLLRAGLIDSAGIVIDAKSGVTGAGRQAKEEYSFSEVDEDLRAYKLLSHQHTPEIERHLSQPNPVRVTFTAHLLPLRRGLLATCYARPRPGTAPHTVAECLGDAYRSSAFVRVVAPAQATIKAVAGTNLALVGAVANTDVVVAVGVIDNLVKGAAGQAVQNLNLLLGLDETAGLDHLQRFSP